MTPSSSTDPAVLSRVMREALTALRDGRRCVVMPVTRRALTRRGLVVRVARPQTDVTVASGYDLVITAAGRATLDAAREAA